MNSLEISLKTRGTNITKSRLINTPETLIATQTSASQYCRFSFVPVPVMKSGYVPVPVCVPVPELKVGGGS